MLTMEEKSFQNLQISYLIYFFMEEWHIMFLPVHLSFLSFQDIMRNKNNSKSFILTTAFIVSALGIDC